MIRVSVSSEFVAFPEPEGSAGVRRVVVGVSGSLGSLSALRRAATEARRTDAVLVTALAWTPPHGEIAYRRAPCPPLLRVWEAAAHERLETAFDEAFGGVPQGVLIDPVIIRSSAPGPALVDEAWRPGDLLVVGAGTRRRIGRMLHTSTTRYVMAHATCPVLAVPPVPMLSETGGVFDTRTMRALSHLAS